MQTLYAIIQLRSNMHLENGSLHYNHDLEAKLVQVMNTKVVPCDILNMFKVLLRSHKHFTHWSHVNPSLGINLRDIISDINKVVKIEFDMLMLMNAQWHLCSWNANVKCILNTRVLQLPSWAFDLIPFNIWELASKISSHPFIKSSRIWFFTSICLTWFDWCLD